MRVYLLTFLLFISAFGASANSCEELVLKKYNEEFHQYLSDEFKENSDLELFKSFGFLGSSTTHGFRMALNLSVKGLLGDESLKKFEEVTKKFISSKSAKGEYFNREGGYIFFYPKTEELPCHNDSLYLEQTPPICSVDQISFNSPRVNELKNLLDSVFKEVAQLELKEVDKIPSSNLRNVEVLIDEELVRNEPVLLSAEGGTCDMGKSLKKKFSCSITSGNSMSIKLTVGTLQGELTLTSDDVVTEEETPKDGFFLSIKSDKGAQYKLVQGHVYVSGLESEEELAKVSFFESENCTYISKAKKILKCQKLLTPYSVQAVYTGIDKVEKSVEIGSFGKFSLKVETERLESLNQIDNVIVLSDGNEITPSTFKDLGLSLEVKDFGDNKVEYSVEDGSIVSEKELEEYKYTISLKHNSKVSDSKEIIVKKYVDGNNYFFDIIKRNRQCHFSLMMAEGTDKFRSIGHEEYLKKMMQVKVHARSTSCSNVQKTKSGIQVFCALSGDRKQERVRVQLFSGDQELRSVTCLLINEDYEEEEESEDRDISSRTVKSKNSGSDFADSLGDAFSQAFPSYLDSKFQTQQPSFYNPLMYNNYGYSPYYRYTPGFYQDPGLWNTMYMFNPATY